MRGRLPMLLAAAALLIAGVGAAQDAGATTSSTEEMFTEGNRHYAAGRFDEARAVYSQLADAGVRSAKLYYNLANAQAQTGMVGEAVLNYERARRLAPRNNDNWENLKRVAPNNYRAEPSWWQVPFVAVRDSLSGEEWLLVFGVGYLLFGLTGAVYFATGGERRWPGRVFAVTSVAVAVLGVFAGASVWRYVVVKDVVVVKGPARVLSGPGEAFSRLRDIDEGTIVRQLPSRETDWVHVELPDGRRGFLPASSAEAI